MEEVAAQADRDSDAIIAALDEEVNQREKVLDEWYGELKQDLRELDPIGAVIATVIATALVLMVLVFPFTQAHRDANKVRTGHAIRPPSIIDPFNPLAIRAELATVRTAAKPGEEPALDQLRAKPLIYLGKSDGTAVFYDPGRRSALYLPAGSIIIELQRGR